MAHAFVGATAALDQDGVMVVVFANKEPAAWDALVTSIIASGCTVNPPGFSTQIVRGHRGGERLPESAGLMSQLRQRIRGDEMRVDLLVAAESGRHGPDDATHSRECTKPRRQTCGNEKAADRGED